MVPEEWPIDAPSDDEGAYPARAAGRRRLSTVRKDFFLDPRDRLTEQERALMTAMLADLLGCIADEIRAGLPSGWAAANDEDSQHLLHELSSAGLLDRADLIALLLRRADEERIGSAVRARAGPGGAFLQALIADDDERISAAAMAVILARGRRRDRLGQPRVEFEDLPDGLASPLVHGVAAALRCHAPLHEGADLRFAAAAGSYIERRDEAKAIDQLTAALVHALNEADHLEERLLEAAAEEGDITFLAHALAERAGITPSAAWNYLVGGDGGSLLLLLRMAGISRQFAASLLALLGDLVGIADLGTAIARFDTLDEAQATSAREWLQLDPSYRAALSAMGFGHGKRTV